MGARGEGEGPTPPDDAVLRNFLHPRAQPAFLEKEGFRVGQGQGDISLFFTSLDLCARESIHLSNFL